MCIDLHHTGPARLAGLFIIILTPLGSVISGAKLPDSRPEFDLGVGLEQAHGTVRIDAGQHEDF